MRRMMLIALIALSACGKSQRMDESTPAERKVVKAAQVAHLKGNPEIIHAMDQVPSGERGVFQRALSCEVKRNAARHLPAIAVTPTYITDLHERIRKNPRLTAC